MVTKPKSPGGVPHPFYHRKIARSGSSRYLAVSKMLPEDWLVVKVEVTKLDRKVCVLEITKLA